MRFDFHPSRALICFTLALLFGIDARAGEEDEIVTGCHFSNAEWGADAIDRCIKDNQKNRALVLAYPERYEPIVTRCRRNNEYGWDWVKKCVDNDIEAEAALTQYPKEHARIVDACMDDFKYRGAARIKLCIDMAITPPEPNPAGSK
jgi:hypothetical protein